MAVSHTQVCAGKEAAALLNLCYAHGRHPSQLKLWRSFLAEGDAGNDVVPRLAIASCGADLCDLVRAFVVPESLARAVTADTLRAIAYLHNHQIVHRDVKSENVRLAAEGCAVLKGTELATRLSNSGCLVGRVGTPGFIAPEVILGHESCEKVDCFAMGVVLFFVLAGALPFDGPPSARLRKTLSGRVNFGIEQLRTRSAESQEAIRNLIAPNADVRSSAVGMLCHSWFRPEEADRGQTGYEGSNVPACDDVKGNAGLVSNTPQATLVPNVLISHLGLDATPMSPKSEQRVASLLGQANDALHVQALSVEQNSKPQSRTVCDVEPSVKVEFRVEHHSLSVGRKPEQLLLTNLQPGNEPNEFDPQHTPRHGFKRQTLHASIDMGCSSLLGMLSADSDDDSLTKRVRTCEVSED